MIDFNFEHAYNKMDNAFLLCKMPSVSGTYELFLPLGSQ